MSIWKRKESTLLGSMLQVFISYILVKNENCVQVSYYFIWNNRSRTPSKLDLHAFKQLINAFFQENIRNNSLSKNRFSLFFQCQYLFQTPSLHRLNKAIDNVSISHDRGNSCLHISRFGK
jgi:DNA primase